jgi:hypothetical protein
VKSSVFDAVRASAAQVMARARSVRIDDAGLAGLVERLRRAPLPAAGLDPAHAKVGDDSATLAYVLTLDAINFGSGYFPFLDKPDGRSGYFTIATGLERRFRAAGPWSPAELANLDAQTLAKVFRQDLRIPEVAELMDLYARGLNDLGAFVGAQRDGRFESVVEAAGGSAAALVEDLSRMPFYRDIARYDDFEVPFLKRAQISVSDLYAAFSGAGFGGFSDVDDLTMFADNLVPHVLRRSGALVYADGLARRIDAGEVLASGSPEEVEIRAAGVHAVESCVRLLRASGVSATARQIDTVLWNLGQHPDMKAHPRHRTRCTYY